jgi:hypothetical protein
MTRRQIKLYWHYLKRLKFKELEQQATIMWGYDPDKENKDRKKRELAEKGSQDPLYGFPNDIDYLGKDFIEQKISITNHFGERIKRESRWDQERGDACLGRYGMVARRCSMNDKLWGIYQKSKAKSVRLSLTDIKKMILIDIKRSKLYPPGWTDDTASPPDWHLEKLRKEGLLEGILREIDEAAKT